MQKLLELETEARNSLAKSLRALRKLKATLAALEHTVASPHFKPLGPRCGVINFSQLGTKNWSVEYHDPRASIRLIVAMLSNKPWYALSQYRAALRNGFIRTKDRRHVAINPFVLEQLRGPEWEKRKKLSSSISLAASAERLESKSKKKRIG